MDIGHRVFFFHFDGIIFLFRISNVWYTYSSSTWDNLSFSVLSMFSGQKFGRVHEPPKRGEHPKTSDVLLS